MAEANCKYTMPNGKESLFSRLKLETKKRLRFCFITGFQNFALRNCQLIAVIYIFKDFSGEIIVDLSEGIDARFFSFDKIPSNLSSTIKEITEEFLLKYNDLKEKCVI